MADGAITVDAPYEERLRGDPRWALREGSLHFDGASAVFRALRTITARLDELGIPYALAGGMAVFLHGYRRFTEEVALLVTAADLDRIHAELEGRGFVPPFLGSRNLRDAGTRVRIEFLVTGHFPGDGKPKPVAFPTPSEAGTEIAGIRCLRLDRLIELKLASGTAPGRRRDLADVLELIRLLNLPAEFAMQLDASVQPLYRELWEEVQAMPEDP